MLNILILPGLRALVKRFNDTFIYIPESKLKVEPREITIQ